jgi:hypothetical protein
MTIHPAIPPPAPSEDAAQNTETERVMMQQAYDIIEKRLEIKD